MPASPTRVRRIATALVAALAGTLVVAVTAAPVQAATGCDADCIASVAATSTPDAAYVQVSTTTQTRTHVQLTRYDGTPVAAYGTATWSNSFAFSWSGLAMGTRYRYRVVATDTDGHTWQEWGEVSTKVRDVSVTFTSLTMIDDSDPLGSGEILGAARISDPTCLSAYKALAPLAVASSTSLSSGSTLPLTATVPCAHDTAYTTTVQTIVADDDSNISPPAWSDYASVDWFGYNDADYESNVTSTTVTEPLDESLVGSASVPFSTTSSATVLNGPAGLRYSVSGAVTFTVSAGPAVNPPGTGPVQMDLTVTPGNGKLTVAWGDVDAQLAIAQATGFLVDHRLAGGGGQIPWASDVVPAGTHTLVLPGLTNGSTYEVRVERLFGSGEHDGATETTAAPVWSGIPSTLTGWDLTPAAAPLGSTLPADLTVTTDGQPRGVALQHRAAGTPGWTTYSIKLTDAAGHVSFAVPVLTGTEEWQVGAPATPTVGFVVSATRTITAATSVTGLPAAGSALVGALLHPTVQVTPGAGRALDVQYQRAGTATWTTYGTVTATATGSAVLAVPTLVGTTTWRVVAAAAPAYGTAAVSSGMRVVARSTISGFSTRAVSAKVGVRLPVTVIVKPGARRWVTVQYRRLGTTTWRTYQRLRTGSTSKVVVGLVAKRGRYAWRVVAGAVPAYGGAVVSGQRVVTGR